MMRDLSIKTGMYQVLAPDSPVNYDFLPKTSAEKTLLKIRQAKSMKIELRMSEIVGNLIFSSLRH